MLIKLRIDIPLTISVGINGFILIYCSIMKEVIRKSRMPTQGMKA